MTHKFIKREIPTEISEAGGAMIVLADKDTVELETSIQEAQDGLYVIGDLAGGLRTLQRRSHGG